MDNQDPLLEPQPQEEARPILNEEADFLICAATSVRNAFSCTPSKVLLREGTALYRFLEEGFAGPADGYWLPVSTYHQVRNENRLQNRPIPDWAVSPSVPLPHALAPKLFCEAVLAERIYAFRGSLRLPDGEPREILWIPGLTPAHLIPRTFHL